MSLVRQQSKARPSHGLMCEQAFEIDPFSPHPRNCINNLRLARASKLIVCTPKLPLSRPAHRPMGGERDCREDAVELRDEWNV